MVAAATDRTLLLNAKDLTAELRLSSGWTRQASCPCLYGSAAESSASQGRRLPPGWRLGHRTQEWDRYLATNKQAGLPPIDRS